MQDARRRISLLRRLSRLRQVEKHSAAMHLAQAHGVHGKLLYLSERSGEIASSYAGRTDLASGGELAAQLGFLAGLDTIVRETEAERRKAMQTSEYAMQKLAAAERRLDRTSDKLRAESRAVERALEAREIAANPDLARKLNSTG